MTNTFARANPLLGLTTEEYRDFASALVSYVAFYATADETTYFMSLCREYTLEITGRVAVPSRESRQLVEVLSRNEHPGPSPDARRSALKKPRSH